jgi:hypothetical protein
MRRKVDKGAVGWTITPARKVRAKIALSRELQIPFVTHRCSRRRLETKLQGRASTHGKLPGDRVFNKSLTIVLPIHNGESRLRAHVRDLLEIASELTPDFKILIVDDGSTDATYEVAESLEAHYPQVSVRRHRYCRGLGSVMDYVRRHVRSDAVIFHDGVSPIDVNQLRNLWRGWIARFEIGSSDCGASELHAHDVCDFANLPAIHAAMERAHGQLLGFHLLASPPEQSGAGDDELFASIHSARTDSPPRSKQKGVGQIPRPPRPKFLSAVAEFAFGE